MKVLSSCVAQKYGDIKADISLINKPTFNETFNEWKYISQGTTPCRDVYRGYSWEFIKNISSKTKTQIISAGYGIIDLDFPIVPYKCTFSNKFFDKGDWLVPNFNYTQEEANQKWLNKLTPNIVWGDETTLITCNPDYLKLLNIPKQDNLIILNNYKLTRLSKWLGAGAHAISNRFTQFIVDEYPNLSGNSELQGLFKVLDKKYGKNLRIKRDKVTDDFIIRWAESGKSLKQLRDSGYSCSDQRFKKLQDIEWLNNNPKRLFTKY